MATSPVRVIEVRRCGTDVLTMRLERPPGYSFNAGQWFRVTLDTFEGPQARTFSHASAPGDDWLEFTTRLSDSAFKRSLSRLDDGASVSISPPGGRFGLPEGAERIAFLVGGVGITPVRGLLRHAAGQGRPMRGWVLFFGNRDTSCEPYLDELMSLEPAGLKLVRVLERAPEHWEGEQGLISAPLVLRHLEDPQGLPFVVAGPPVMVQAMNAVLDELGVGSGLRHVESFGRA